VETRQPAAGMNVTQWSSVNWVQSINELRSTMQPLVVQHLYDKLGTLLMVTRATQQGVLAASN
jgi:hypothetical protein